MIGDDIYKMKTPFLIQFKSDHLAQNNIPKGKRRVVLITDNSMNLFKGVYVKGVGKGETTDGINPQFIEPYDDSITIKNNSYWQTAQEKGLTQREITEKLDELWAVRLEEASTTCPDCGAEPGANHTSGCDVARCESCRMQALACGCDDVGTDKWDGLWPGVKECYELRLLTWSEPERVGGTGWTFDLNTLAEINASKL